jgi:hypothetical protein
MTKRGENRGGVAFIISLLLSPCSEGSGIVITSGPERKGDETPCQQKCIK